MPPLREWKKNNAEPQLTSSLRPRKGIVVYNERQLQTAAREERRSMRASTSSTSSHHNSNHHHMDVASTSSTMDSPGDEAKTARKRSNEDLKKKDRNAKVPKVEPKAEDESLPVANRRSSRISAIVMPSVPSINSSESSSPVSTADDEPTPPPTTKCNGVRPTMTVGEALMSHGAKFSELAKGDSDAFDRTMASVLSNITSKSHPGYLKMSHKLASVIAINNSNIVNNIAAAANRKKAAAGGTKPYVYKPRVPRATNENGLLAIIKNAAAADPSNASLLSAYKPRILYANNNNNNGSSMTPRVLTAAAVAASEALSLASSSTASYASTLAAAQPSPPTLSAALAEELAGRQAPDNEPALSHLFGGGRTSCVPTTCSSPMPCLGTGIGRRVAPNFTCTNVILRTSFPAELQFSDYYRPCTQPPLSHVMARITVDIRSLGKALFYDDPSWSRYTFPQRSLFAAEALVYFYHSQRWPGRKLVLVPFGESITPGDFSYTCGSCFKFQACLRHRFDLAPRDKIPVIMARNGQLLDDPDAPPIPHICDPAQLSDKERDALAEYGELMAGTREANHKDVVESCGTISAEMERHNLLIVVSRLTECCSQLMSVGFDFTCMTLRDKAYDIADEINLPRHCITDAWLQNVGKWLGIANGDSVAASAAIFGDGNEAAAATASELPNADAAFTNANDYLKNMVSVAMSLQAEEDGQQPGPSTSPDSAVGSVEPLNNVDEALTSSFTNDHQPINDTDAVEPLSCEGVSVLVSESRPIELVFNNENGMVLLNQSAQLELDKEIKVEADVPAESLRLNVDPSSAAVPNTIGEVCGALSRRTPRRCSGSSASGCAPTASTSSRSSSVSGVTSSRKASGSEEPKETANTSSGVPSIVDKKTLYTVIQESFTKTNYPEVANALTVIKRHVLMRDHSLLPMFNNFSARISKMMYTTKPRDSDGAAGEPSPVECNGTVNSPFTLALAEEDVKSFFPTTATNVAGCS